MASLLGGTASASQNAQPHLHSIIVTYSTEPFLSRHRLKMMSVYSNIQNKGKH